MGGLVENKHLLFYSSFCPFSADLLSIITKRDLRAQFVMIAVDRMQKQLPAYVDRVPVMLTADRRVLKDQDVFTFINSAPSSSVAAARGASNGGDGAPQAADPVAAVGGGCANTLSDSFSFIGSHVSEASEWSAAQSHGYLDLNAEGVISRDSFPRIHTPPDDSVVGKSGGEDPSPDGNDQHAMTRQQMQPQFGVGAEPQFAERRFAAPQQHAAQQQDPKMLDALIASREVDLGQWTTGGQCTRAR